MTKVSVIMNCLNGEKYLKEAIDSVFAQTFDDWEIIFWDNCSADRSAEIAQSYSAQLKYFRSENTVPLGKARNLAINESTGEYIAFLDVDDIWENTFLEKMVKLMDSDPNIGIGYADCGFIDKNSYIITGKCSDKVKFHRGYCFKELLWKDFIPMPTAVIRRWQFGLGFNNAYQIAEEYELFLRIARYRKVDYIDEVLAKYRFHDSNASKNTGLMVIEELVILDYWCDRDRKLVPRWMELVKKIKLIGRYGIYNFKNVLKLPSNFIKIANR